MKKTKKIVIGSLIAITLGVVGTLAAGGFEHRWGNKGHMAEMMAERMMKHATEALDLTEVQQGNLKALQDTALALRADAKMGKRETRKEIMSQLSQPTLDQAHILGLVQARIDAAEQKIPTLIAALAVFFDSLTAEQKAIIMDKIEKRQSHGNAHHGGHPGHN